MALAAVAGLLLLSAALLGHWTPLQAQEGEAPAPEATGASGVTIRLDDLVGLITYSFVDRFEVQLTKLDAATTYEVVVSSSHAVALGIGGCGEATQRATVTGATSRTVEFHVFACGLGPGTVTAALRAAGASRAEVTVSQSVTVEPIPDWVPADQRPASGASGASGAVAQVGTPGFVRNPRFEQIMTTSVVVKWDTPSADGGEDLSGYGLLFWNQDDDHPSYRDDVLVKGLTPREHTYTGLQHDATYKFRIHACNEDNQMVARCGWWTTPPLEVTTQRAPTPRPPHTIMFPDRKSTSVRVTWRIAAETGGVPLTGFDIKYWPYDSANPDSETGAKTHPADDGNDTRETLENLEANKEYELKMRACNGPTKDRHCSIWSDDHRFQTLASNTTPTPEAPRPQNLDLTPLGDRTARLSWTWSDPNSVKTHIGFRVTARVFGLAGEPDDDEDWPQIHGDVGPADQMHRVINLNDFVNRQSTGQGVGLAHHAAYELRVEAIYQGDDIGDLKTYSDPSETIVIIDTPITHATAFNASTPRQATLLQRPLNTILNDSSYAHVSTEFRFRKVGHERQPHTALFWKPTVYTTVDPKANWELGHVYGVQVVFTPTNATKPPVYAARDAYVWPSSQSPGLRERVASFPYGWDAVTNRTYTYRICNHTLPQANRMNWHGFIRSAMGHWGTVTSARIRAEYETGGCEDYTSLASSAVETAMKSIDVIAPEDASSEVKERIRSELNERMNGMFEMLSQMGYDYGRSSTDITPINEVRMAIIADDDDNLTKAAAHSQLSRNVGLPGCAYTNPGCAVVSDGHADIFINYHRFSTAELKLPTGFRFDHCLDSSDVPMKGVDVRLYRTIVHEVTHAFGINYPARFSWQEVTQRMHHPNSELSSVMASGSGLCGPTQLDRLAVHAKYQGQYP